MMHWTLCAVYLAVHVLLTALAIIGLYAATELGMILQRPADWLFKKLPLWLAKPLIGCPPCMASIWGSLSYWAFTPEMQPLGYFMVWPFFVLAVSGLTKLIYSSLTQAP